PAANAALGVREGTLGSVVGAAPVGIALPPLDVDAVIHERVVPGPGVLPVECRLDEGGEARVAHPLLAGMENMEEYGTDIRLDEDDGPAEGEGENGPGGVGAHSGQVEELFLVFGKAAGRGDAGRGPDEGEGPAVVAEAAPEGENLRQRSRRQGR